MKTINIHRFGRAALVLIAGLATGHLPAVLAQEPEAAPDPMSFVRGAQAWANNCARCHNMRDPKEYRDEQWRAIVAHMQVRAALTTQDSKDILRFLQESN